MQRIFEQDEKTGRLLAWLAREQSLISTIARIQKDDRALVVDPIDLNACFADFYSKLYSSRARYSSEELSGFLNEVSFPTLTPVARENLDSPITLEEVQQVLGSLQSGKTPGMMGFHPNFTNNTWRM